MPKKLLNFVTLLKWASCRFLGRRQTYSTSRHCIESLGLLSSST